MHRNSQLSLHRDRTGGTLLCTFLPVGVSNEQSKSFQITDFGLQETDLNNVDHQMNK